jgi:hypothetical protein
MKLKLHFGLGEPAREINWYQSEIRNFPYLVTFKGKKYEFVLYDEDKTNKVDYLCHFSEMRSHDPNFYATTYYDLDYLVFGTGLQCQCGAIYTDFPWDHMKMCPKWIPWSQLR